MKNSRQADHPILPLILNRWSPRAMTGEAIPDETLLSLFEAARWAPSSYNAQPWRFIYAKRNTKHFDVFMDFLIEFNQGWCKNAAVLGVSVARKTFEHNNKPSITHAYDAGAAWENLALEGSHRGLVVHGMEGFDYAKAKKVLEVPDDHEVLAMFAIGVKAPTSTLPAELQKREEPPSGRKKIEEFIMEGKFKNRAAP